MTVEGLNAALDRLPRTHVASAAREAPAFRASGVTGFYGALLALTAGGLLAGRSLLVLAAIALVAAASFFVWAFVRRAVSGREELVLLEHVWFAEACVAAGLAAIGEPVLPYLDVLAVALCPFLAGGRVGCLLAGCCYGRPSNVGIRYGDAAAGAGFPRHLVGVRLLPVPALESAGLIVIGATGLAALPFAPAGTVFTWFLASYAIMRFGLEALRGDRRPHFLGLSVNRWMCVTEITVALAIGAWPLDRREWALASFLGAALVACVVLRRARDDRRRLFAARQLDELRRTVAELAAGVGEQPLVARTSAGAAVAVSRDIRMRFSLSVPGRPRDLPLLCDLAVRAGPAFDSASVAVTDGVLHLSGADAPATADELYGSVVRALQEPRLETMSAYFGRHHAA